MKPHIRTTIVTIERPLIPSPPRDARPHFCLSDMLVFYKKGTCESIWEQRIPECKILWTKKDGMNCDEFTCIGSVTVFYDKHFGWQLRWRLTHEQAERIRKYNLQYNRRWHNGHWKREPQTK